MRHWGYKCFAYSKVRDSLMWGEGCPDSGVWLKQYEPFDLHAAFSTAFSVGLRAGLHSQVSPCTVRIQAFFVFTAWLTLCPRDSLPSIWRGRSREQRQFQWILYWKIIMSAAYWREFTATNDNINDISFSPFLWYDIKGHGIFISHAQSWDLHVTWPKSWHCHKGPVSLPYCRILITRKPSLREIWWLSISQILRRKKSDFFFWSIHLQSMCLRHKVRHHFKWSLPRFV